MSYHWIRIFDSEDALENYIQKGTFLVLELRGEKICLTRTEKGIFAVQDKCPHNGASLSKGFCTAQNEIVCPLHRYSYDLQSGKGTSGGGYALKTYPVNIREDGVYLGIKAKWWEM
jgi:nitrite reductase/ring-hydroxylating ferredoxin subunit